MLLNVRLPSLIVFVVFSPFLSSFFVQLMWWLVRFYFMSVSFCCVRCASVCINSTKARSRKREKKSSIFVMDANSFFSLFMSSYFNEKLNVLILARVVLPMQMILWFNSSRKLWCITLLLFRFSISFACFAKSNGTIMEIGTHFTFIALSRSSRFRSKFLLPYQHPAKSHWLLVRIVIHSTNGFIVRNAIYFAAPKLFHFILFHLEWRIPSCRFCRMNSVNLRI